MIRDDKLGRIGPGLPGHRDAKGQPSIVPKFREIRHNFIIGLYESQEDIDTDDGSSYYQTHHNYLAMAGRGLKSDFGGQWNHHWSNIYGYVGSCMGGGPWLAFYDNVCISRDHHIDCGDSTMTVLNNTLLTQTPGAVSCNGTVGPLPTDAAVTLMAKKALLPFPLPA